MIRRTINLFTMLMICVFSYANTATAGDYYKNLYSNQIQHQLYFSVPLHGIKVKNKDAPIRIGFRSTFERGAMPHFDFNNHDQTRQNFRMDLVNLEFTGTNRAKFKLAGLQLAGINKRGLYMGQDADADENADQTTEEKSNKGGKAVLGVLGLLGLVALAVAYEQPTEEECFYESATFDGFQRCLGRDIND